MPLPTRDQFFAHGVDKLNPPQPGTCGICLMDFAPPEPIVRIKACTKHTFHTECLKDWLHVTKTCPMCRKELHCSPVKDSAGRPFEELREWVREQCQAMAEENERERERIRDIGRPGGSFARYIRQSEERLAHMEARSEARRRERGL